MVDAFIFAGRALIAAFIGFFGVAAALAGSAERPDPWASASEIRRAMRSIEWPQPTDPPEEIDTHLFNRRN